MRKFIALILLLTGGVAAAQIYDPVTWSFSHVKTGENSYELIFQAVIEDGSHIYAMKIPEGGPIPTSFTVNPSADFTVEDSAYAVTEAVVKFDEAFGFKIGTHSGTAEFRLRIKAMVPSFSVTGEVGYMACNNVTCSPPKNVEFDIKIGSPAVKDSGNKLNPGMTADGSSKKGLLGFFLLSMLAGLAGILTPCVFPMIPMTVAFFSRDSETRSRALVRALVFGLSIILLYSSLGILVSLTSAGAGFANALSTHWIPNLLFFSLFVVFAASFFGAFELVLPNKWVSGADSKADRGGVLGSFFMGLTTVIVSFSCTGPIIGALLVEAASGDVLRPTIGMFGFGLAFALPFTLFALFPTVLAKLPRSGGWLNSVKVVLGFLMLAFSLKFLSTLDSVYSLKLISRDLFLAIWIVLFTLLGLYLMGKIKFSHDSDLPYIGTFRFFLIIAVFTFVVILLTGLFGAPLKRLASLLPSQESGWFSKSVNTPVAVPVQASPFTMSTTSQECETPKYADKFTLPYGLKGYFDYKQGLSCAKEKSKPVLLDFKGHACANCKLMEAKVWSDPEVLRRLNENFVIVALYLDDRTQLPENEWITSKLDGKVKKTIGKINEDLEISLFNTNAMPLYVIADHEGKPLIEPMSTNLNIVEFRNWLDGGLRAYNSR
jgi:thiol:disulfide interchange protein DsbD